jgi:hypothetical protein
MSRRFRVRHTPDGEIWNVVVALQIHHDLVRPEVVVLAQVDDLADDIVPRDVRAGVRPARRVPQALNPVLLMRRSHL